MRTISLILNVGLCVRLPLFVCTCGHVCARVHACARVPLLLAVLSLYLKMVAPVVLFVLSVHNNLEFVI